MQILQVGKAAGPSTPLRDRKGSGRRQEEKQQEAGEKAVGGSGRRQEKENSKQGRK